MGGDINRLIIHLEHIAEAATLLRAGGVVRERMALVAADHLAEVLLQDYVEETFVSMEEEGPLAPRRYNAAQRQQLLWDFTARVELASTKPRSFWPSEALLDTRDASVFRVAHQYRNALYHGDRHNSSLGRPLAVEYLQAVGRALVRSWSAGLVCGGYSARDARLKAFRRLGARSAGSSFAPRIVAEECVGHLVGQFRVQRAVLGRELTQDVEDRAEAVKAKLDHLGELGLTRDTQKEFMRAVLLWGAYRADPELVALQDEREGIVRGAAGDADLESEGKVKAYAANELATQRRRDDLTRRFRAPVTINSAARILRSARTLSSAADIAALLKRYQQLDERLLLLEQAVARVDVEFDRMLEREIDLSRGK